MHSRDKAARPVKEVVHDTVWYETHVAGFWARVNKLLHLFRRDLFEWHSAIDERSKLVAWWHKQEGTYSNSHFNSFGKARFSEAVVPLVQ